MGVLLVRHSDAVSGGPGVDDAARWLTPDGRAKAGRVASALKGRGLVFERFLASPRVRAMQTAEIFAQTLGFSGEIEAYPPLSFTVPADTAAGELAMLDGHIAAFGHMPTIAEIAQLMVSHGAPSSFGTSQAVWIDQRRVLWSLDPYDLD